MSRAGNRCLRLSRVVVFCLWRIDRGLFQRDGGVWQLTSLRNMRNNVRNMRNSSVLTALFPQVRQGVLAATLTQPEKWWYLSELAERLHTSPSSLQRELASLVASGILVHRREGTRAYFKAETKSPVFRDLQQLFEKTAGLADLSPALRKAEAQLGREVNVTAYFAEEFRERIKSRDHFLTAVLREKKQFVKGGQRELDEIVGK